MFASLDRAVLAEFVAVPFLALVAEFFAVLSLALVAEFFAVLSLAPLCRAVANSSLRLPAGRPCDRRELGRSLLEKLEKIALLL